MIELLSDPAKYLYHYTSAATALQHILKTRLLRFSNYLGTNDPKETKTWQFDLGTNTNRDLGKYRMAEISAWLSSELKNRARVLCFSKDQGPLTGNHLNDIFKRGYCKPRMWAHYAERHAGVCLVFDRTKLAIAIDKQVASSHLVLSGDVEYVDRSVVGDLYQDQQYMINVDALEDVGKQAYPRLHLKSHYRRLFFEKMTDWRDECEWRWVALANSDRDLFVAYGDALTGVMFGENTPDQVVTDIMSIGGPVQYMGLKWKNCSPWYDYSNLRYVNGLVGSPWKYQHGKA